MTNGSVQLPPDSPGECAGRECLRVVLLELVL